MNGTKLLEQLNEIQMLTDEQLSETSRRLTSEDPHALLQQLVQNGVLTSYQANRVWFGKIDEIVLGQYRILNQIGTGSFGQVFKALHTFMKRSVAIKFIQPDLVQVPKVRQMFLREMHALTNLQQDNIVMAYDANELDGQLYLVMEHVEGRNLEDIVDDRGPLPIFLVTRMMREAASALQFAYEKGIVHRDIKPENLMVLTETLERVTSAPNAQGDPSDRTPLTQALIKITDFGLARILNRVGVGSLVTSVGDFVGTPTYASPRTN